MVTNTRARYSYTWKTDKYTVTMVTNTRSRHSYTWKQTDKYIQLPWLPIPDPATAIPGNRQTNIYSYHGYQYQIPPQLYLENRQTYSYYGYQYQIPPQLYLETDRQIYTVTMVTNTRSRHSYTWKQTDKYIQLPWLPIPDPATAIPGNRQTNIYSYHGYQYQIPPQLYLETDRQIYTVTMVTNTRSRHSYTWKQTDKYIQLPWLPIPDPATAIPGNRQTNIYSYHGYQYQIPPQLYLETDRQIYTVTMVTNTGACYSYTWKQTNIQLPWLPIPEPATAIPGNRQIYSYHGYQYQSPLQLYLETDKYTVTMVTNTRARYSYTWKQTDKYIQLPWLPIPEPATAIPGNRQIYSYHGYLYQSPLQLYLETDKYSYHGYLYRSLLQLYLETDKYTVTMVTNTRSRHSYTWKQTNIQLLWLPIPDPATAIPGKQTNIQLLWLPIPDLVLVTIVTVYLSVSRYSCGRIWYW